MSHQMSMETGQPVLVIVAGRPCKVSLLDLFRTINKDWRICAVLALTGCVERARSPTKLGSISNNFAHSCLWRDIPPSWYLAKFSEVRGPLHSDDTASSAPT